MKILILKFNALGDVIRTSYILPGLYKKYNGPVIDWITSDSARELLRHNPYIRILASPQLGLEFLESNHYDLVLSFDDEDEVLRLIEGIRCDKVLGAYTQGGKKMYSPDSAEWFDMGLLSIHGKKVADARKKQNTREHNQIFADMLGIKIDSGIFFNSALVESKIAGQFDKTVFNIGINPSAGSRWKSKEMPFAEVCKFIELLAQQRINKKNVRIHLLGGVAELERHVAIKNAVRPYELRDWGAENTLLEFAAIVKGCDYIVSSDSLALHLAISQRVPNLSFYAPTSANEIGTFGSGVKVLSLADDYCSYSPNADNASITAERLLTAFRAHGQALDWAIGSCS